MTEPTVDELFAMVTRKQTEARHQFDRVHRSTLVSSTGIAACMTAIASLFETQAQLTLLLVKIERRTRS